MSAAPANTARRGFVRNPAHLVAIRRLAGQRVRAGAEVVTQEVRALLDEPGLGEQHPGEPRPASLPGDPPTSQTGDLARSQTTRGPRIRPTDVVAASGSDEIKAFWLQIGTSRIAPRPYMRRALLASKSGVLAAMAGQTGGGA